MSDWQAILEQVQRVAREGFAPPGINAPTVARDYANLCAGTNQRLRRCRDLLKTGMAAEALKLAAEAPPLLELARTLQFPELEAWQKLCQAGNWPRPEPLDQPAFNLLAAAGSDGGELDALKRDFRRAMLVSDVRRGVLLLRELSKRQPEATHWLTDLAAFERRRQEQLRHEFEAADTAADAGALEAIAAEFAESWSTPADPELLGRVRNRLEAVRLAAARDAAARGVAALSAAYAARNVTAADAAMVTLEPLLATPGLTLSPGLQTQYDEAAAWYRTEADRLAAEAAFDTAVAALAAELDRPHPGPALTRHWHELQRLQQPVPEALARRTRLALDNLAFVQRRRRFLRAAAVALLLLLAAAGVVLAAREWRLQRLRAHWAQSFLEAYEQKDFARHHALLQEMQLNCPQLVGSPFAASVTARDRELADQDAAARQLSHALLTQLEALQASAFAGDPAQVNALFKRAADKTVTAADRGRLEELRSQWDVRQQAGQENRDGKLRGLLEPSARLLARAASFATTPLPDIKSVLAELQPLQREMDKVTGATPELQAQAADFRARAAALAKGVQERETVLRELSSASTLAEYLKAARTYAAAFPEDPVAKPLAAIVLRERDYLALAALPPPAAAGDAAAPGALNPALLSAVKTMDPANPWWYPVLYALHQGAQRLETKWPEVKKELLALNDIRTLTELRRFDLVTRDGKGSRDVRPGFVDGEFADKGGRINGVFVRQAIAGKVYVPGDTDTQPQFKDRSFTTGVEEVENITAMPHTDYVRSLVSEVRKLAPADTQQADLWLAGRIAALREQQALPPLLRLRLLDFLSQQLQLLAGEDALAEWQPLVTAVKRVDPGLSWLCSSSPAVAAAEREATAVLETQFATQNLPAAYAFNLALRRASVSRGVHWVGTASLSTPVTLQARRGEELEHLPELWVLRTTAAATRELLVARTRDAKGNPQAVHGFEPGEPVFAPADGLTTAALLTRLRKQCGAEALAVRDWPPGWPLNARE